MSKQQIFVDFVNENLIGKKCIFVSTCHIGMLYDFPDISEVIIKEAFLLENGLIQILDSKGIATSIDTCYVKFPEYSIHAVANGDNSISTFSWKLTQEEIEKDVEDKLFPAFHKANKEMRNEQ